uniref:Cytochrome c assembly protein domain-containing protein n=1 Tax=Triticum urartu TaxID=4572 RepID=A0A8R7UG42_TRIUA
MKKRELRLSMNSRLTELLALLCFSLLSYQRVPNLLFEISSFVPNRLQSNPVPQDPISAIHPPCIYAGDVASAMGFGLCRSKMMNGIVALHSPPMRKDAAEKNGTLLRSAGCVGSHIRSSLFTRSFKHFVGGAPALLLRSNRSLLMLLRRRFFAFSSLWTGALMDTGREQAKACRS